MNLQEIVIIVLNHLRGMWRYRWQLVIVAWLTAIPGWFFVYSMPDVYGASAKVSVDTNNLLPALTKGLTAGENLGNEVGMVSRALLTRPNLAAVARATDLDLRAETPQQLEDLITGLQRNISVSGGRDQVFTISYEDRNREKAVDIVAAILNIFVETSLSAQGDDAEMTERAIRSEIDDHERRLVQAEADLAAFKKSNLGYMPDNGSDYYTRLQAALANVTATEGQMRQLTERRDEIERQLKGEVPGLGVAAASPAQIAASCSKAENISQLRAQLSQLQVDFTDKHPRIVMIRETLDTLQAGCESELAAMGGTVPPVSAGASLPDANPVYQNLRLQLSDVNVELAALSEVLSSHRQLVASLRADVDKISVVETEFKKLNRDYDVIAARYQELLRRWETLQSKKRLDPVTDTVQFKIIEPPFSAAAPVAPNRPLYLLAVLVLALGAGCVVAFGLDQLKPVFFNRRELSRVANIPVLGSVSMIMSQDQVSARRRRTFAWAGANLALLAMGVVVVAMAGPISEMLRNLTGSGF